MDDIDPEIHPCINSHSIDDVCDYYDNVLNLDKTTYKSSNDEPTPLNCVKEMINSIPSTFWQKDNLKISKLSLRH